MPEYIKQNDMHAREYLCLFWGRCPYAANSPETKSSCFSDSCSQICVKRDILWWKNMLWAWVSSLLLCF